MNKLSPLALALGLICTHSAIAEEGFRQHDAHVHGEVEFNIAQDGNELLIEITAPGSDVVGFEHAPETQQQSKTLEQAITQLNKATTLFTINQSAQCKIEHASVRHTLSEDEHHDHDHHADDSHHHQAEHDENHHEHEQHSNHGEFT
ncbi:MAG TPA: DUF2796 domain-containing protein, partial [Vibrio sp.]|nr:DUF2796 domain-containing protein [Vibrio sp.]